ncbi:MAG: hypothetical protein AAF591_17085 [Verrucomicrobiota bacterium]
MKAHIIAAIAIGLSTGWAVAGDLVLPYRSFGPQVIAHELIGMQWWRWQNHGDSQPREYPIKVVVYWDTSLDEIKRKYPVSRANEDDYRYVTRDAAISHIQDSIKKLKEHAIETSDMEDALVKLQATAVQPLSKPEIRAALEDAQQDLSNAEGKDGFHFSANDHGQIFVDDLPISDHQFSAICRELARFAPENPIHLFSSGTISAKRHHEIVRLSSDAGIKVVVSHPAPSTKTAKTEQGGAGQPATRGESK